MKLVRSKLRPLWVVMALSGMILAGASTATATSPHQAVQSGSTCTTTSLRMGDRGSCVKQLQTLLNKAGAKAGAVDGSFGPGTKAAVSRFQKSKKLKVDGIAGRETWGNLMIATRKLPTSAPTSCSTKILRKGARGNCVKVLQSRLAMATFTVGRFGADGGFGNDTRSAVISYQKFYGLKADGVVGPKTWKHIVSHPNPPASRLKHLSKVKNYGGVNIVVDKSDRKTYVFRDGRLEKIMQVRLGGRGVNQDGRKYVKDTPTGVFKVQTRIQHGYSRLYEAKMPYFTVFNGNVGFHYSADFMARGYGPDGKSGSHGCVNMNEADAKYVFDTVRTGTSVVVQA